MPSTRRLKTAIILAVFATLTILYVTQAPSNTHTSPFYTRTVAAIQARRDNEARESLMAEEKTRADRVARIQEEHDQAMVANKQKPIVEDVPTTSRSSEAAPAESKPAASRKMSPPADGTTGNKGGKVVVNPNSDDHEGVARVGNTGSSKSHESSAAKKESQNEEESASDHEIEVEMNSILKKGPIIIFSKSYCPFSMKAKVCSNSVPSDPPHTYTCTDKSPSKQHILLSSYTITPPPYVVELDLHPLGPGLQAALQKSTGRRTVPNVLINGKSIGGGDDVAALHSAGTLEAKVKELGGKRIMEVKKVVVKEGEGLNGKREVKFKG